MTSYEDIEALYMISEDGGLREVPKCYRWLIPLLACITTAAIIAGIIYSLPFIVPAVMEVLGI